MTWQCDIGVILDMVSTILTIRAETEGLGCGRVFVVEGLFIWRNLLVAEERMREAVSQ